MIGSGSTKLIDTGPGYYLDGWQSAGG